MIKNKFQIVIIDDEQSCIHNLTESMSKYRELEVVGTANNPNEGKHIILNKKPDLLFVDVEMPGKSGLELVHELREDITWNMQVVFYTAYDKYLLEALRESAFDYLLKPYEEKEFKTVIDRFFNYMGTSNHLESFGNNVTNLYDKNKDHFLITTVKGYQLIRFTDVGYFEYNTLKRVWNIVMPDLKKLTIRRGTSAGVILSLSPLFLQINQHQIINTSYLATIENKLCTLLPPFNKVGELTISRKFTENVEDHFLMI